MNIPGLALVVGALLSAPVVAASAVSTSAKNPASTAEIGRLTLPAQLDINQAVDTASASQVSRLSHTSHRSHASHSSHRSHSSHFSGSPRPW